MALDNANWPTAQEAWVEEVKNPVTGQKSYPLTKEAGDYVFAVAETVNNAPSQVGEYVQRTGENTSIAPTDISGAGLTEGLYNVLLWSRVEVPDGASSSVQITLTYTSGGVVQTFVGTLVNGNLTTSKSQQTVPIWIDGGTSLTYQTAYASGTPGAMEYQIVIVLQLVRAAN